VPAELLNVEQLPVPASTPAGLLQIAVENNFDIDKLEKLMALHREWEAGEARKAFFAALSKFQSELPPILKTGKTDQGRAGKRKFATLGAINEAIRPWLYANGLSFRFAQSQTPQGITVTCIVSHCDGHSEETTLTAGADVTGGKNPIQSIGSTITYLERYTLVGALGLTTVDEDDDGGQGQAEPAEPELTPEQRRQAALDLARQAAGATGAQVAANQPTVPQSTQTTPPVSMPPITQQQMAEMLGLMKRIFPSGADAGRWLAEKTGGINNPEQLSKSIAVDILVDLNRMVSESLLSTPPSQGPESGNARLATEQPQQSQQPTQQAQQQPTQQQPQPTQTQPATITAVTAEQRGKIQQLTIRAYGGQALTRQNDWLVTLGLLRADQLSYQQAEERIAYLEQVTGDIPF
jgi:hypothetical protein